MENLTPQNTNAEAHRLAGDTLTVTCIGCDQGEVIVTDMIEEPFGRCLECGEKHRLFVRRGSE